MVERSVSFTPRPYPAMVPDTLREDRATKLLAVPSERVEDAPVIRFQPLKVAVVPVRSGSSSRCANSMSGVFGTKVAMILRENHASNMLLLVVVVVFVSAIVSPRSHLQLRT